MNELALFIGNFFLPIFRYLFWITHEFSSLYLIFFAVILIMGLRVFFLFLNSIQFFLRWRLKKEYRYFNMSYDLLQDSLRSLLWISGFSFIHFSIVFWF